MLEEKLTNLPKGSGIYLMKDDKKNVIYVGKAINLKNRVRSYFQNRENHDIKTRLLVEHIRDFDYIITDNEVEALLLEIALIKKYRPHYNIQLKDDKSYPYIKISAENYPTVTLTRDYKTDGGKYFGPYTNAMDARKFVEALNLLYPIKMCKKKFGSKKQQRPCINYDMGLCLAPCSREIDKEEYDVYLREITAILNGDTDALMSKIRERMGFYAAKQDFETAAVLRDYLYATEKVSVKQKISMADEDSSEVLALAYDEEIAVIAMFERAKGELQGKRIFVLENISDHSPVQMMTEFIKQYYSTDASIPKTIYLQYALEEEQEQSILQLLTKKKGSKVVIKVPKIGDKKKLVDMLEKNAQDAVFQYRSRKEAERQKEERALAEIKNAFGLQRTIERMEAFDISNIMGSDQVGAMVVYEKTKRAPKAYRRFRIKYIEGQDDYAAMGEVVFRRLKRAKEELENGESIQQSRFLPLPEIIFVDGGQAHVKIIQGIVEDFGFDIQVGGLKKDISHRLQSLWTQGRELPLEQLPDSKRFLREVSDEVHRYAYEYHAVRRRKSMLDSELTKIPLVGEKRKRELLRRFEGIEQIQNATIEELIQVEGIDRRVARNIKEYFEVKTKFNDENRENNKKKQKI